jgi:hypothetical protein
MLGWRRQLQWQTLATVTILHIEHPISDYEIWRAAFDAAEPLREGAGVRDQRVFRPIDDDCYVVVHLDFLDAAAAAAFVDILRNRIWNRTDASPALRGEPRTAILELAGLATTAP